VDGFGAIFRNEGRKIGISKRILIPPFPGSNPGAPASTQGTELITETALFSPKFLDAFGNGFHPAIWKFCAGFVSSDAGQTPVGLLHGELVLLWLKLAIEFKLGVATCDWPKPNFVKPCRKWATCDVC
jgi:hypothetical protein